MTQSPTWDYKTLKSNTELNTGGIIASSNIPTKAPLEPAGDKQTQVEVIRS